MSEDEVQIVALEELGDDVLVPHAHSENDNPQQHAIFRRAPLDGFAPSSRPMTAGDGTLSELDEISLSGIPSAPAVPAPLAGGGERLCTPSRDCTDAAPPWSPASTAGQGIPTLDEEPIIDISNQSGHSPTSSEKAKAGCAVM